ncbi:MAG TPA: hypothetical protein VHP58_06870 [Alphaproteobacteria bacterium]|nr:hypothetical protein [Alphaproteobacteria bacterium]
MLWLLAALGTSVTTCANAELNRRYQHEGFRLNFWRTLLAALLWLPLALPQQWPTGIGFYAAAVFGGLAMIIGNVIQNHLSARHNGRVAILWMPLKALFVFVLWAAISPPARQHIVDNPLTAIATLSCFAIMIMALNSMRAHDASWKVVKMVLPVAVVYALSDIFARSVVPAEQLPNLIQVYFCVATAVSAGVSLLLFPLRPKKHLPWYSPSLLKVGALAAVQSTINQTCFFVALIYAPNPAYVSMIILLAPLWLLIYHRVRGIPDNTSPLAGLVMALAAGLLLGVTL